MTNNKTITIKVQAFKESGKWYTERKLVLTCDEKGVDVNELHDAMQVLANKTNQTLCIIDCPDDIINGYPQLVHPGKPTNVKYTPL